MDTLSLHEVLARTEFKALENLSLLSAYETPWADAPFIISCKGTCQLNGIDVMFIDYCTVYLATGEEKERLLKAAVDTPLLCTATLPPDGEHGFPIIRANQ